VTAHTHIAIVGAGPGGVYTALRLAQLGISSTLIDRAQFPRAKACGDVLTSNVLRALHSLDPTLLERLLLQAWVKPLAASAFVSHRGDRLLMPFHSPANAMLGLPACLSARREDFDAFLLAHARQQPEIDLQEGMAVHNALRTGGRWQLLDADGALLMTADYLVLATGGGSRLVRALLPQHHAQPKHSAVGLRAYFTGAIPVAETDTSEFFLFDRAHMPGGLYVTPFSDGGVNVNLVVRQDVLQRSKMALRERMLTYLAAQPELKARFASATMQGQPEGALLSFGTLRRPISGEGLLVVGDAAGLTDATNANGIGHAMISGGIAAQFLQSALSAQQCDPAWMRRYDAQVYARLHNSLYPGKVMNLLFANRFTSGISARLLNASFRRLNSKAVSELVYSSNTNRTLLNPRFYLRLFSKDKG
jgi:menaquinone-9 beta-reductase